MKPKKFQFEWNLLVLVTAALVLFGLVMVYSATSGSAALANANPLGFVGKQAIYAFLGVALLVVVSRLPLERIRQLAPTLVVTALVLCLGVLASARASTARDAGSTSARSSSSRPSSRSSRSSSGRPPTCRGDPRRAR